MKIDLRTDVIGDSKKFDFMFNGFIIGGSLTQQKGMSVLRREIVLLGKLEGISKVVEPERKIFGDELARELVGGTLDLSKQEYDMLYGYMANVPWSSGKPVRDAVEIIDWLESQFGKPE